MSVLQRGGPNLSFAGVILLALLGTFALKDAPLDSARPVGNGEWLDLPNDQALPAKLWQDPEKVERRRRRRYAVIAALRSRLRAPVAGRNAGLSFRQARFVESAISLYRPL